LINIDSLINPYVDSHAIAQNSAWLTRTMIRASVALYGFRCSRKIGFTIPGRQIVVRRQCELTLTDFRGSPSSARPSSCLLAALPAVWVIHRQPAGTASVYLRYDLCGCPNTAPPLLLICANLLSARLLSTTSWMGFGWHASPPNPRLRYRRRYG